MYSGGKSLRSQLEAAVGEGTSTHWVLRHALLGVPQSALVWQQEASETQVVQKAATQPRREPPAVQSARLRQLPMH